MTVRSAMSGEDRQTAGLFFHFALAQAVPGAIIKLVGMHGLGVASAAW